MTSIVNDLMKRIDKTIPPLVPDKEPRRIFLLDATDHPNVGDCAILLGETAFMRRTYPNASISIVSDRTYTPDVDKEIDRADLLFLHGGGNFGDIWPQHHDFRLHILNRFAGKTIVHFPQSFHFTDPETLATTRQAIAGAKSFVLLARDFKGLDFAKANFDCQVELCPDMAFAMGPLQPSPSTVDFSCLLRTDKEVVEDKAADIPAIFAAAGATFVVNDWLENRPGIEKMHGLTRMMMRKGLPATMVARHGLYMFEMYARSRLRFGISLLSQGGTVVTDRLHGNIIATLIGRPRILFDSLGGKVRALNDTWLSTDPNVVFLDRVADLKDQLAVIRAAA